MEIKIAEWDKCNSDAKKQFQDFLGNEIYKNSEHHKGIFCTGGNGTGKTFLMYLTAIFYLKNYRVLTYYTSHSNILQINKNSIAWDNLLNTHILFIDEFGKITDVNYFILITEELIDYRLKNYLPTYIASNYTEGELEQRGYRAIIDRINDNKFFKKITLNYKSLRR